MRPEEPDKLPQGLQLTPVDETFRSDPYPIFKQIREEAPALYDEVMRRFLVSPHDDVKRCLFDKGFFTDPAKANPGTFSREVLGAAMGFDEKPSMLLMDEPDHRRLRSLVSAPFRPANVERWRSHIRDIVESTLDEVADAEFDLIGSLAGPVPTVVIAEMLGVDPGQRQRFKAWSDKAVQIGFNPFPTPEQQTQGEEAIRGLDEFLCSEITRRRQDLGNDLISDMLRAEIDGDKLTEQEIISQCRLLLIAGNVTTTDLIGNAVNALIDHPEQMEKLREDCSLVSSVVEETLRYDSPVLNTGRIPDREVEMNGCPIGRGESISVLLGSANRDPSIYPNPDCFDIEREDKHHYAFGGGRHLCLGAHLARVEAQEALLGLISRYQTIERGDGGYTRHAIPSFRGFSELWVRVT